HLRSAVSSPKQWIFVRRARDPSPSPRCCPPLAVALPSLSPPSDAHPAPPTPLRR
ncbi:hypothetical protein K523DRAFT_422399, partial [Schizophyllum commune Tattone D]